jgi:hypothetical protein
LGLLLAVIEGAWGQAALDFAGCLVASALLVWRVRRA